MIGKINIDFQVVHSGDPKIIMVADFSSWLHIETQPAVLSITLPGSRTAIQFNFEKNKINGYNSNNLGIGCSHNCEGEDYADLPDGIYDIKLEASPNTFNKQRYYLKTDKAQLELDKLLVKLGFTYNEKDKEKINNLQLIDFLLQVAGAATRLGDIPKASEHFSEALKLIEKIKECKNCL